MSAGHLAGRRDAVNVLYDHGCDLVVESVALRDAAGDPRAGRAAPAVIGCVETALLELASAIVELDRATAELAEPAGRRGSGREQRRSARMHQGFENLQATLRDAADAAAAARGLVARALDDDG